MCTSNNYSVNLHFLYSFKLILKSDHILFHQITNLTDEEYIPPTKKPFVSHSGPQSSKKHRPSHQNHHKKKQASSDSGYRKPDGLSELDVQIIEDEVKEAERWNLYNWLGHGDLDPALWTYEYR